MNIKIVKSAAMRKYLREEKHKKGEKNKTRKRRESNREILVAE